MVEAVLNAPPEDVARMREALVRILAYGRSDALPTVRASWVRGIRVRGSGGRA
ncbi:hypothetical protein AB0M64_08890 [Streptomyces sp. NPDC051771]|uniref:hypothetical protein n=1 Tax=Streptomyces sp. NPDC051771 TaxID=3154847 RepID=UPI0034132247